jgi:hypothetical protein
LCRAGSNFRSRSSTTREAASRHAAGLLIRDLDHVSRIDGGHNLVITRDDLAAAVRSTTNYRGASCTIAIDASTGNRIDDPVSLTAALPTPADGRLGQVHPFLRRISRATRGVRSHPLRNASFHYARDVMWRLGAFVASALGALVLVGSVSAKAEFDARTL